MKRRHDFRIYHPSIIDENSLIIHEISLIIHN